MPNDAFKKWQKMLPWNALLILILSLLSQPLLDLWQVILFGLGLLAIIIGFGWALIAFKRQEQSKSGMILLSCIVLAYILSSFWLFNTDSLAEYMPTEYDNFYVRMNTIDDYQTSYTWCPSQEPPTITKYQDGYFIQINGGGGDLFYQRLSETKIRNFWWPGASTGNTFFDLTIIFENADNQDSLTLYSMDQTIAHLKFELGLDERKANMETVYLFDDLGTYLPSEISAILNN